MKKEEFRRLAEDVANCHICEKLVTLPHIQSSECLINDDHGLHTDNPYVNRWNIHGVKNCFLMPTDKYGVVDLGYARMPMMEALGLVNISIRLMPARFMYHCYLENKRLTFKDALL